MHRIVGNWALSARVIAFAAVSLACLTGHARQPSIFFRLSDAPTAYTQSSITYHVYDAGGNEVVNNGKIQSTIGGSYYIDADNYEKTGYSFAIELNNAAAPGTSWISERYSFDYCRDAGAYRSTTALVWDMEFVTYSNFTYVVPEPNSGLLLLVGAGLMALRRRYACHGPRQGFA